MRFTKSRQCLSVVETKKNIEKKESKDSRTNAHHLMVRVDSIVVPTIHGMSLKHALPDTPLRNNLRETIGI